MYKRIALFLATNLAIIAVISILLSVFNVQPYLSSSGLNYSSLLIYALIIGFTGSFISLFISKWMAKRAYNIHLIQQPGDDTEAWLLNTVRKFAEQMKIGIPEVGIYDSSEPNAFATGWNRNNALVTVSSGLLQHMDTEEVEAVLGHEVAHVANGDMVTLALIQGVVNTFVIFFARIAAYFVTRFFSREEEEGGLSTMTYFLVSIVFEILFGILASMIVMKFSRYREFRADAGAARYAGSDKMIKALQKLQMLHEQPQDSRAPELAAMKISGRSAFMNLLSSHPPLEKRIAALQKRK